MLPRSFPDVPEVRFGAGLKACEHLAGDFYHAQRLDHDHVGFLVGDVMGHGPAAALLAVYTLHQFRPKWIHGDRYRISSPAEVMTELNESLIQADFPGSPFVTMIYGVLNTRTRRFTYSAAGHPPALLDRLDGATARLGGVGGPLLGVFQSTYEEEAIVLEVGDRVAMYTDGVELVDWGGRGAGIQGLAAWLNDRSITDPSDLALSAIAAARPLAPAERDDVTLLIAEVRESQR
jgi:sigma-B regulation protein RsbU (phosphoserine phosphatase)